MATKKQIEAAAQAIKFLVPPDGGRGGTWTAKGLAETKWPKDFMPSERKLIRAIAKAALGPRSPQSLAK